MCFAFPDALCEKRQKENGGKEEGRRKKRVKWKEGKKKEGRGGKGRLGELVLRECAGAIVVWFGKLTDLLSLFAVTSTVLARVWVAVCF